MEIIYQGNIALDGSTKIICNSGTLKINTIVINNLVSNYNFTLKRHMDNTGLTNVLLYDFDLSMGETLRDTETYILNLNNNIQLLTDVINTTFYISATQI